MIVGVLAEQKSSEQRVALTPGGVRALTQGGHGVVLQSGAGVPARFADEEYIQAGARVVYAPDEVFGRAALLLKMSALRAEEIEKLSPEQTVMAFHHLAASPRETVSRLLAREVTLIGFEVIEDRTGDLPVLHAISEIAGQLSVHVAAHLLETRAGGRGILLGGATGIPPAHVVILGAGVVGLWAAKTAVGNRAQVTLLDTSLPALRQAEEALGRNVITEVAHPHSVARAAAYADALIGAVLVRGEKAPHVVTREMVQAMKPGSVIIDVSIDQGGCVATSRPTTAEDPVFVEAGVVHYAVPNMTSAVARTASLALTHAALPYLLAIAERGVAGAIRDQQGLAAGVYTYRGQMVYQPLARAFGLPCDPLIELVGSPDYPDNIYA